LLKALLAVPVRTAERMRMIFEANKTSENVHFEVVSNPEVMTFTTTVISFLLYL